MKIVYVITRLDVIGGASVHLLDLVEGAQRAGHEVEILGGGKGLFLDRIEAAGIKCTSLKHLQREISLWHDFLGFFELRREIKKAKPDLVHLHSSKAGILGRLVAKTINCPSVFTAHGWAFTEGVSSKKRKLYLIIERFMAKFSDKIITVSEFDRQLALRSNIGSQLLINTVHNGMPNIPILQKTVKKSEVKLIMVARFDEQKDHSSLIKAISKIEHRNWHLEFVGDGPLMKQAVEDVKGFGLVDNIKFSGSCNDVAKRLERADVFLLISNWEGLPLTILEAMRAGLPVIASSVGGVSEAVIDGETGFLVQRGDVEELSSAIDKILDNEEARLVFGKAGRKKFDEEFLFDSMLNKTLGIYQEVVK